MIMARSYIKHEHVRTLAELPEKLVKGRIYFVDDEGYIVIDHGDNRGTQIYGNRPGIQGEPGEPIPQIFSDIETHSVSIMNLAETLLKTHIAYKERFDEIENVISALIAAVSQSLNIDLDEIKQAAESVNNSESENSESES